MARMQPLEVVDELILTQIGVWIQLPSLNLTVPMYVIVCNSINNPMRTLL